jgi:hypothetical protein
VVFVGGDGGVVFFWWGCFCLLFLEKHLRWSVSVFGFWLLVVGDWGGDMAADDEFAVWKWGDGWWRLEVRRMWKWGDELLLWWVAEVIWNKMKFIPSNTKNNGKIGIKMLLHPFLFTSLLT